MRHFMSHLFKLPTRALGAHSRSLMSDAQKAGLREAESYVNKGEIDVAASKYNEWWQKHSDYLASPEFRQDPESRSEFAKKLPKMLKAFWQCDCDDGCKDHIAEAVQLGPEALRASLFSAAAFGNKGARYDPKNSELQREVLSSIAEGDDRELLLGKHTTTGRNLIETAFLGDNTPFVAHVKNMFGIPNREDLKGMDHLEIYCMLKDRDVDPELKDLLLGEDSTIQDIA